MKRLRRGLLFVFAIAKKGPLSDVVNDDGSNAYYSSAAP